MSKSFEAPSNIPNPIVDYITEHRDGFFKFAKEKLKELGAAEQAGDVPSMADDLIQIVTEKMLNLMKNRPDYPINDYKGFLRAVIYNEGVSMMRKVRSEKTKASGAVNAAEIAASRSPLDMEEPINPEDENMAKEVWRAVTWGDKEIGGKTFSEYVKLKEFERNVEIVRDKSHDMSAKEILKHLQERGYMQEYDINNEKDVKKAGFLIDQIYSRMLKRAKKWLESMDL